LAVATGATGQRRRPGSDCGVGGGIGVGIDYGKAAAGMVGAGASGSERKVAAGGAAERPGSGKAVGGATRQRQRPSSGCRAGGRHPAEDVACRG